MFAWKKQIGGTSPPKLDLVGTNYLARRNWICNKLATGLLAVLDLGARELLHILQKKKGNSSKKYVKVR